MDTAKQISKLVLAALSFSLSTVAVMTILVPFGWALIGVGLLNGVTSTVVGYALYKKLSA